jgi:hypothetical protein
VIDLKGGRIAQEDGVQKHIPFTEPVPVKTIQGAEYEESVSPAGLIVLKETKVAPKTCPVATYVPPAKPAYSSFVLGGKVSTTDKEFRSVKMNMLSPEARVIFNRKF